MKLMERNKLKSKDEEKLMAVDRTHVEKKKFRDRDEYDGGCCKVRT